MFAPDTESSLKVARGRRRVQRALNLLWAPWYGSDRLWLLSEVTALDYRSGPLLRERGLRNLGSAKRWVTAGAAGLAVVFSLVAARTLPGHNTGQAGTASRSPSTAPDTAPVGSSGLQAPAQLPTPAPQVAPSVVSGGS